MISSEAFLEVERLETKWK